MNPVLHVIDASCDETQLQVLQLLRTRLAADGQRATVCSIDGAMAVRATRHWGEEVLCAACRPVPGVTWVSQLPNVARRAGAKLLHAWGVQAAAACTTRLPEMPLVLSLLNPHDGLPDAARWLRSFPVDATVVADSQIMGAGLVSAGIVRERVVVIRAPVDFGAINRARRRDLRSSVVADASPVLLLPGPPSRAGGHYQGVWAAAVLKQVFTNLRLLMPYDSPEGRRLVRFAQSTRIPNLLAIPDPRLTWSELVTCADVFVVPAVGDVCTPPILTAMAAGLVVVGSAVRSVAELIGSGQNGLLCKPGQPRLLAGRILHVLEDDELRDRLADRARAHAFEIAGIRAFADNFERLYDNVLSGLSPGDGVSDTAMVA